MGSQTATQGGSVIALDVGTVRIGVALASKAARIASPLVTLANDQDFATNLQKLIEQHEVDLLVVGLPRSLSGQDTQQTTYVREFVQGLQRVVSTPVQFQDEAVTSVQAEDELRSRKKTYSKADIDKHAAAIILQDYLTTAGIA